MKSRSPLRMYWHVFLSIWEPLYMLKCVYRFNREHGECPSLWIYFFVTVERDLIFIPDKVRAQTFQHRSMRARISPTGFDAVACLKPFRSPNECGLQLVPGFRPIIITLLLLRKLFSRLRMNFTIPGVRCAKFVWLLEPQKTVFNWIPKKA